MFRSMRRSRQQLSDAECIKCLKEATSGVLALLGDDGYPYTVPLSYAIVENKIVFHGAKEGHKMDAIKACDKASFCIIYQDDVIEELYTTLFKSVIVFGKIRIVEEDSLKRYYADELGKRYRDGHDMERKKEIDDSWNTLGVIELQIEHMTGKQSLRLMNNV